MPRLFERSVAPRRDRVDGGWSPRGGRLPGGEHRRLGPGFPEGRTTGERPPAGSNPSLGVSPASVPRGGTVTATWSGI
jgi:hypothetical protein